MPQLQENFKPYQDWLSDNRTRQWKTPLKPGMLDFCSNDYLKLTQHPDVKKAAIQAIEQYGAGSTGARLLSGNCPLQSELEEALCRWLHLESCLLFNTGFQTNSTVIPALLAQQPNMVVLVDKLCHASIYQGLIGIAFQRFRHNDMQHLAQLLAKNADQPTLVITEHLFSMNGDYAPLEQLKALKNQYNAILYLDIAHSIGIAEPTVFKDVDIVMGAFGKAMGSIGAFIGGPLVLRQYLMNACRGFVYTTALPPASLAATLAAVGLSSTHNLATDLLETAAYFRNELQKRGYDIANSNSHIIPVVTDKADHLETKFLEQNMRVGAIHPPTTTSKRLRFSLTSNHTKADIKQVLHVL